MMIYNEIKTIIYLVSRIKCIKGKRNER